MGRASLGRHIAAWRMDRGCKQVDLAAMAGLHKTTLCHAETGYTAPVLDGMVAISMAMAAYDGAPGKWPTYVAMMLVELDKEEDDGGLEERRPAS